MISIMPVSNHFSKRLVIDLDFNKQYFPLSLNLVNLKLRINIE